MTYSGRHETNVITETFHKKSHDQINSQSENKKIYFKKIFKRILEMASEFDLPKYSCNTANDMR